MTPDTGHCAGQSPAERGQTLHDYVAGISVFVLTLAVVLGLLPGVLAPFQAESGTADATQAGRIGDRLVENLSFAGAPNVVNATELDDVMGLSEGDLQARYGLASHQHVNMSLRNLNGSTVLENVTASPPSPPVGPLTAGASAANEDAASAARIVVTTDNVFECKPACRLVVRVW